MNPILVLLLQRADDEKHADRAWHRMLNWTPAWGPSQLSDQADTALRLTKEGADRTERCKYDGKEPEAIEPQKTGLLKGLFG
jgi:hypothetical protein